MKIFLLGELNHQSASLKFQIEINANANPICVLVAAAAFCWHFSIGMIDLHITELLAA